MRTLNLREIVNKYELDTTELASKLFPDNRFPTKALERVLSGISHLNSEQIGFLASYLEVPVDSLYSGSKWYSVTSPATSSAMELKRDNYTARFYSKEGITRIYMDGTLLHEMVMTTASITLKDYLESLDSAIYNLTNKNHESNDDTGA